MHTQISAENPYGNNRWGFAWEHVPAGGAAHLDFGCHDGTFLSTLKKKNINRLAGVDISAEAISKGKQLHPDLEITKIDEGENLPFSDEEFNSITILDVLEHVYEQSSLLAELNRVLKDEGKLVVTVPGQHLFSFLDKGNFKFCFPRLHKWYYCMGHSEQEYTYRYVSNPDGLIGDISAKKRWHEQFRRQQLRRMLGTAGFEVVGFDGTGFFQRAITSVNFFLKWFGPVQPFVRKILALDAKVFESTNLFCVAKKQRSIRGNR